MFGIPPEGIALILPIDHFCDMARSMTNVLGNSLATAVIDKWETKPMNKWIDFHWTKLFNPEFYITMEVNGIPIGIYMVLFIVFAETGLFAGFFLPGDSLLFFQEFTAEN